MPSTWKSLPEHVWPSQSRQNWHAIIGVIAFYAMAALAMLPFAANAGPELPGITPLFVAGVLVPELATSFLLLVRFVEARTCSLLLLGCAYVYSGLMPLAHLMTFPGAVVPIQSVLGSSQSTAWIFVLWLTVYALLTLVCVLLEANRPDLRVGKDEVARAVILGVGAAVLMVIVSVFAATEMVDGLPALMVGSSWSIFNRALNYLAIAMLIGGVAVILVKMRDRDELFLWLAMALTAMAVANILSGAGGGRYTVGWSVGRVSWLVSAFVLFLFFMRLLARQQRLLERSVAQRTAELQQSNEKLQLLMREQEHRSKNLLAVVHAITSRTLSAGRPLDETRKVLEGRLRALASAHSGLLDHEHSGADLGNIVKAEVSVFSERITVRGPSVRLGPQAAQMLALVVHELATNATKYGALSSAKGRVTVTWLLDNDTPVLRFRWSERGGPPVTTTERVGFGRTILENLVCEEFASEPRIDYAPGGLTYELDIEVSRLRKGS